MKTPRSSQRSLSQPHRPAHVLLPVLALCLASVAGSALSLGAETPRAVIPYKYLASVLDNVAAMKDKDRLILTAGVYPSSTNKLDRPVELQINAKKGPLPVKLSPSGELVDFPLTPELRAENPPVLSNQPKGTLTLRATINIRYSGNLSEKARWYMEALNQANSAIKYQAGLLSFATPKLKNLVPVFAVGTTNAVVLKLPGNTQSFIPNAEGKVRIPITDAAQSDAATLLFPSAPLRIEAE